MARRATQGGGAGPAAGEAAGGIQSLDGALRLLGVLARRSGPTALGELAREAGMPPPRAHRYLASFVHAGLARKDGGGLYDLGREAAGLGLAALARLSFVNDAADALPGLSAETGLTALLSVWGNMGPTVVRWQRAPSFLVTSLGLGTSFPLLSSATGRAFLAHLPQAVTGALLEAELKRARAAPNLLRDLEPEARGGSLARAAEALARRVRAEGLATVDGRFIPGLVAAAAPVLNWQAEAEAVVTLIGTDPRAIEPGSPQIRALREFCEALSIRAPTR